MPRAAKRPCRHPGCPVLVEGGACEAHAALHRRQADRERGSAAARGYDHRWRKARADHLAAHPLCVACQARDRVRAATVVDHKVPHRGCLRLFWDRDNWQSLCKQHHDHKTATEDGAFTGSAVPWCTCLTDGTACPRG